MIHAETWRSIDRHFEGRLDTRGEAAMREHLPECADCRAHYRRHLLYSRLARKGAPPRERLARGLGLRLAPRQSEGRASGPLAVGGVVLALAAVLLLVRTRHRSGVEDGGFVARGGGAPAAALWIYRLADHHRPEIVGDRVSGADELAFAYGNAAGKRYVAIFAADEHRHLYWYYPAWPPGRTTPPAADVAAQAGPGPHELREAVQHTFDGRHLSLVTVLSDEPLNVAAVERAFRDGVEVPLGGAILPPDAIVLRRALEVRP